MFCVICECVYLILFEQHIITICCSGYHWEAQTKPVLEIDCCVKNKRTKYNKVTVAIKVSEILNNPKSWLTIEHRIKGFSSSYFI